MNADSDDLMVPINSIPFSVIQLDHQGIITGCNGWAERFSGYCLAEIKGQPIEILLPDKFTDAHVKFRDNYQRGSDVMSGVRNVVLLSKSKELLNCTIKISEVADGYIAYLMDSLLKISNDDKTINEQAYLPHNIESLTLSKHTHKILNSIEEAFWEWNIMEGTLLYSAQVMAMLGYHAESFLGPLSFCEKSLKQEDLASLNRQAKAHCLGEIPCIDLTLSITTEQGATKWLTVFGKIMEYKGELAYKMFGSVKDITAQHQLVEKLKERNNYLLLAESLNKSGHWRLDCIENTLYWSTELYKIHGVDPTNYRPKVNTALDFYLVEEQAKVRNYVDNAIANKQGFYFKSAIKNQQGKKIKVECVGEVELNTAGDVVGIFGVFKDITQSETIFEKLKLLAMVNYTIKVPVFFIDDKDNVVYQDLTPNTADSSSVLFNYINFSITDYLAFKRKAKACGQLKETHISFDQYNSVFDLSVTYEADEGIFIWIVENVTEQFRKDQQQLISNRLALLGNTFGNVSHDINNVLGVALGATEMLEIKFAQGERDISTYIERVKNAIDKGKSVTERLLAFTRKPTIKMVRFDPIQDIIDNQYLFKQLLLSTIDFRINTNEVCCEIKFPQGEFINILLNLVLNSQDAIRERGLIGQIEISANLNKEQNLEIHVKDSGVGIEQSNLTKVFDPFYSSKSVNKGNGIGLANVYSTIYKHNGHIQVEGHGSLGGAHFTLVFKCRVLKNPPIKAPIATKSQLNMKGKRVLILDDEISIAEFVSLYLENEGVKTQHTDNKVDLINILATEQPFDIFITDMILPDISGREAAELVKAKFPDIRIFSISGYIAEEDKQWNYPVLRKPFNSKELANFLIENN
ncbi:hybrid sensor histidine kinase/response regulator [Colwellia hornerae]|uniref:histidine kinase n=1 Tax=Colwellia hornerae TaxID=89402 RepID=A0A5C6QH93_9GAMM|nr:ATP-binding protein [Colwellia hornerae]TWX52837.1 response regulator [Colwellia hornerae]TWX59191.1 response regulator [Colwellia hornerae]TWX68219.1 response regulator [Colwellia hornerae]